MFILKYIWGWLRAIIQVHYTIADKGCDFISPKLKTGFMVRRIFFVLSGYAVIKLNGMLAHLLLKYESVFDAHKAIHINYESLSVWTNLWFTLSDFLVSATWLFILGFTVFTAIFQLTNFICIVIGALIPRKYIDNHHYYIQK